MGSWGTQDGPYSHHYDYDQFGNMTFREGWGGTNPAYSLSYANNRLDGFSYDATGNLTDAGGGWTFTYDAEGQQATSAAYNVQQYYDGDRLRGKKLENGTATYYLRSSVLGGQVVAEMSGSGTWQRGYVYLGSELLAVQQDGVYWMHQDPVAKSKRVTDGSGNVVSAVELDPWGGETNRSSNEAFQPHKFTTYERDVNGDDDAMNRRYNRWWSRFEQPDPYDGSYSITDPQSFNRYSYVQNDPVNSVDPRGLEWMCVIGDNGEQFCFDNKDAVQIYAGYGPLDALYDLMREHTHRDRFMPEMQSERPLPEGPGPRIQPPRTTPAPATGYTCTTIGGGPLSVGGIVDSNNQVYGALGIGFSWPPVSYAQTQGSGPVEPGLHAYGSVSNVLAVTLSTNVFHPIAGRSRQVGGGTPAVAVGFQVIVPTQGTTARDWEHHPDNPNGRGPMWHAGRCPY